MAMIVQHNLTAMNANRQLGISTSALAKSTEKLSSGYRINRAADDAAGLAISEKMRSQIRGLDQASTNASDGISMIQTAEGALNESHSILQRMRELAVQAANGTETDEDRGNIQDEIEQLQEELDRIASDTEFNEMKLLDGSLSAASAGTSDAGPKYGVYDAQIKGFITSNVAGVQVTVANSATIGGESAIWNTDGKTLTLNLAKGMTYTQSEVDELIRNAKQEDSAAIGTPSEIEVNLKYGALTVPTTGNGYTTEATVAGIKASTNTKPTYTAAVTNAQLEDAAGSAAAVKANAKNAGYSVTIKTAANTTSDATVATTGKAITITVGKETTAAELNALIENELGNKDVTLEFDGTIVSSGTQADGTPATVNTIVADAYRTVDANTGITVTSKTRLNTTSGVVLNNTATVGNETAVLNADVLTLDLAANKVYTAEELNEIIKKSAVSGITIDTNGYAATANGVSINASNAPVMEDGALLTDDATKYVGTNRIAFTSNKYGVDMNVTINLDFTANPGKESCALAQSAEYDENGKLAAPGTYTLSLSSGVEYTEEDIEALMAAAGLSMDVELSGPNPDAPNTLFITDSSIGASVKLSNGEGLGDEDAYLGEMKYGTQGGGKGIILQVGANEGQTMSFSIEDMSATSLGVNASNVDVSTQSGASESLGKIDEAIQKVSKQRSLLGAVQNRLEHTIANLDNTAENLQAAESGIRDVDMAAEMVTMSKYNILQQAGQSMLAQANQATQGVLSLLQG